MITEAIVKVWAAVVRWTLSLMPTWTPPEWMVSATTWLSDGLAAVGAFAWFLPIAAVRHCFVFLLACLALVWTIRVVRIVASFLSGGGGSAA